MLMINLTTFYTNATENHLNYIIQRIVKTPPLRLNIEQFVISQLSLTTQQSLPHLYSESPGRHTRTYGLSASL